MWKDLVRTTLNDIKSGSLTVDAGYKAIEEIITGDLGFAEVDHARSIRTGFPEVIFCLNKNDADILSIAKSLKEKNDVILLTRARESTYRVLADHFPVIRFFERSGAIMIGLPSASIGLVTVVSAGTSDIPISEEVAVTAQSMGAQVQTFWDIGVAGIHRLFSKLSHLRRSRVIVAVAGMDGALPGVVAGLTGCPVIAVPTSVGYGTGTGGFAALLTMLNSCAPGVAAVNIDNGFGAGFIAALINRTGEKECT